MLWLAAAAMLGGCLTPWQYARDADREVYGILDGKWGKQFGPKSDVAIGKGEGPGALRTPPRTPRLPDGPIRLATAVQIATAHNRPYQREKERLYSAALALTLARHEYARQWFAAVDAAYIKEGDSEQVGADGALGFSQALADGGQIGLDIAMAWTHFLIGDPRSSLASVLSASVTQPLLRGRGREIAQEDLTQAERDALYAVRSFNRFRKEFVVSIVTDYYGVLQALDRVENDRKNYESLQLNHKRVKMMADTGRVPPFQASEVRQSALQAQDRYNRSLENHKAALDRFKIRLALPTDAVVRLDPSELEALESGKVLEPKVDVAAAVAAALKLRLDLANVRDGAKDAKRKVIVAADNLKAQVDVVARGSVPSTDPSRPGRLRPHEGSYRLGFNVDLPLDRKAERNAYREALIALDDRKRTLAGTIDEVKLDVRQAHRDLIEAHTSYRIQVDSLKLAEKRVDMQLILLQEGRATTRNYLDAQADLLSSQNAKTAALVQFTLARLRFYRDVGLLRVRPDGMWAKPDESAVGAGPKRPAGGPETKPKPPRIPEARP